MILWARFKKKQSEEEDDITDWVKENQLPQNITAQEDGEIGQRTLQA